ncbi:YdcF family protein [Arthrospiribacter ruber]|uniref:YdcF family protein n=1 Tax=Arthrospiribacter ruber TaxID=2487934 RepID=A0A951M8T1_9BACT|nr:YdcF family protein [Arthrospiribacter ruber]MBW3467336.1 YdcF family protein [Arthrospiribacter ruber]
MFFYLSQFLSFLAMPLTIIVALLAIGLIFYKKSFSRRLLLMGFALLLFFTNPFISNLSMLAWEPDFKPFDTLPEYELGIVLTGVTNLSKTAYDRTFFDKGADRVTHAIQLYKLGKIKKILITGGQGLNPVNTNTEAEWLRDVMLLAEIPAEDILIENQAKNTYQNAVLAKETLEIVGYRPDQEHLLITSAFHMRRAKGCFNKVGLRTVTFPVDYYTHDIKIDIPNLLYPDPKSMATWHTLFKEWIGITVYKIAGYI